MRFFATLALAVGGLLTPLSASAQCVAPSLLDQLPAERRAALEARAADMPFSEGLLWEATRGEDRLVIAGTLHVPDPRHASLLARLEPRIAAAERVLVEINREDEALMTEQIADDPSIMYLTDGPALPDLLPPDLWEEVKEVLSERGIPAFMGAKFRPWALMVTLSIPPCALGEIADGERGLDHLVMDAAVAAGVNVRSIEPRDTIVRIFDTAGQEAEIDLLRSALIDPETAAALYAGTVELYFAERVGLVLLLGEAAMDLVPGLDPGEVEGTSALFEELMLDRRNADWAARLEVETESADELVVAVGAAHLPGENGLLQLLEADGWAIRPLP